MSILILIVIIVVLIAALAVYIYRYRYLFNQIRQMERELGDRLRNQKKDKILIMTSEKTIQELLVKVNQLIDNERELNRKQSAQEESNRKMLSNISHDLKTPLTVILGYAEMLQSEEHDLDDISKERIDKIRDKAKDVLALIEEFFDVVKIEAGEFAVNIEPVDICEVCREEVLSVYKLIEDAKIEMEIEIEEESIVIDGDRLALKRILSNLIDNAIKYGCDGRYLKLKVYQREEHKYIQVIDHGKGIVEDNQDKIFERLFTLEDSRNKKYQGSGIGLTITKRLVEALGGSLTLRSVPYQETVFTIEF